jgi:glycosyltransferase involved in cell wall biosynthesis
MKEHRVRISVVIPARNERERLPRLLDSLDAARRSFMDSVEVILSDNASTDGTAEIASSRGCSVISTPVRRIAAVRNAGASIATGDILIFVDADMQVHPDTLTSIDRAMASGKHSGGATGVHLPRMSLGLAVTYAVMYPWIVALRMDTGPTFCLRSDFENTGGYDETFQYAEDVAFLLRLSRHGRLDGRRLVRLTKSRAVADLRKFDEYGDWHYFRLMPRLLRWLLSGRAKPEQAFEDYWYR